MIEQIFSVLDLFEDSLWGYVAVPLLMFVGLTLTLQSNFFQFRKLPHVIKLFFGLLKFRQHNERGIHPLKAFFASVGGCVGIGNIAGICTAIQIGGPGALFWIWVTAILGMMIKYSEIYLGLRYRVQNEKGGYNGGPMYFLQHAFKSSWIPKFICILLCIYGVEVYQFSLVTESIVTNWGVDKYIVIAVLLGLVLFATSGGIKRVGSISSATVPLFVFLYIGMGLWVLINNITVIPTVIGEVFVNAFSGGAAVGGFIGSTMMMAMSQGARRACYTGDLGVGYASVIHSESSMKVPQEQAALAIFDLLLDSFVVCTTSIILILVTDVWHEPIGAGMLVQTALGQYFPYMHLFMPFFLFLLGFATLNAYFCVGLKCAEFLSPKFGRFVYYIYAVAALVACYFIGVNEAQTLMTVANGLLLVINCWGIYRLRHKISYTLEEIESDKEIAAIA